MPYSSTDLSFRERVLDRTQRVLVYSQVPPHLKDLSSIILENDAETLVRTMRGYFDILSALDLPDVRKEENNGTHEKVPPKEFAEKIIQYNTNNGGGLELVLNNTFCYMKKEDATQWLRDVHRMGVEGIVAVGPRHSGHGYPGQSVLEATELMMKLYETEDLHFFPGGIYIDTRRSDNPTVRIDEPARMVQKGKAGIRFFFGQITGYNRRGDDNAHSITSLLRDYGDICERGGQEPGRVFVCVSPVASPESARFLETGLEVEMDQGVKDHILSDKSGRATRSLVLIENMLRKVFDYHYSRDSRVPLGVLVEHVTDTNYQHALRLLPRIHNIWREYHPDPVPQQ